MLKNPFYRMSHCDYCTDVCSSKATNVKVCSIPVATVSANSVRKSAETTLQCENCHQTICNNWHNKTTKHSQVYKFSITMTRNRNGVSVSLKMSNSSNTLPEHT